MHDEDLARLHVGLIARDGAALVSFEATMRPVVRGMLRRNGLSDDDADEVWNDAFLEAIERAPTIEPVGVGLRRFVLAVAHNRGVDRIRAAVRSRSASLEVAERPVATHLSQPNEALAAAIRGCLAELKPLHAAVIEMASRGLAASEIALILDISEANAAKIRGRARARMAECLKGVIE